MYRYVASTAPFLKAPSHSVVAVALECNRLANRVIDAISNELRRIKVSPGMIISLRTLTVIPIQV